MQQDYWRKCSVCKKEIGFNSIYYVCSVSSCNKKRSPNQFCSVTCWDSHNAVMNHMSAGADEERSPSFSSFQKDSIEVDRPRRRIVVNSPVSSNQSSAPQDIPVDILVVVSKLKAYIKARSDMNTAADVMPVLSDYLRRQCDEAIENARQDGRKTVMARDF
jgi:histone H3/H4